jgi:hypothetical protein
MRKSKFSKEEMENRMCIIPGCPNKGQRSGQYRTDGVEKRKDKCNVHKTTGSDYRYHVKDYCENWDGSVLEGHKCPTPKVWLKYSGSRTVDHKILKSEFKVNGGWRDGDPHHPANLQTICVICETYKTALDHHNRDPYNNPHPFTSEYRKKIV